MARYLPAALGIVVVAFGIARPVAVYRRNHGSTGVALFGGASWRERLPELIIGSMAVLLVGQIVAWTIWPLETSAISVVPALDVMGASVVILGLALIVRAQNDMGVSWRIGIDRGARPGLVMRGLYRVSRNPIYLGLFTVLAGFALMMPTMLSLLILAGVTIGVRLQVRCEEQYLVETYGDDYRAYAEGVGRFLPWLGRLR